MKHFSIRMWQWPYGAGQFESGCTTQPKRKSEEVIPSRPVVLNPPNLRPFSTVLHMVVTLNHKIIISLLPHGCNFATVINSTVNVCVFQWSFGGCDPQVENCYSHLAPAWKDTITESEDGTLRKMQRELGVRVVGRLEKSKQQKWDSGNALIENAGGLSS